LTFIAYFGAISLFSLLKSKPKPLVGLDIQDNYLRLLQIKPFKQSFSVEKLAVIEVKNDAVIGRKIKDASAVLAALQEAVHLTNAHGLSVAIALSHNNVITQRIKLPVDLNDQEVEAELVNNLSQFFPGISGELCFDFVRLGDARDEQEIVVTAARQDEVYDAIELADQAGLKVKIVDVDTFALMRAAYFGHADKSFIAILEVNILAARFIVLQQHEIIWSQQLEKTNLIRQLESTLQLFYSIHKTTQISELILSGPQEILQEIALIMQKESDLEIKFANPFTTMTFAPEIRNENLMRLAPQLLVSCGLAMRGQL
jgi:type IV pilus assembly protein PilM